MPWDRTERSPNGEFEIRYRSDTGPRDDFYGLEDFEWEVVNLRTGRLIASFTGSRYPHFYVGVQDVRFSEEGESLAVTEVSLRPLRPRRRPRPKRAKPA